MGYLARIKAGYEEGRKEEQRRKKRAEEEARKNPSKAAIFIGRVAEKVSRADKAFAKNVRVPFNDEGYFELKTPQKNPKKKSSKKKNPPKKTNGYFSDFEF